MDNAERDVLDLYGGKDAVLERMGEEFKRGLLTKIGEIQRECSKPYSEEEVLKLISKKLSLRPGILEGILNGTKQVDYNLFDGLEFSFDLSINRVLGKPSLPCSNEEKQYWLDEPKRVPMSNMPPGMDNFNRYWLYFNLSAISRLRKLSDTNYKTPLKKAG